MALQSSGQIDISDIQTELGSSSGSLRTLSAAAGKSSPDAMSEFYGYSSMDAHDHFNTITYTGNASNNHSVTGVGFQPDLVIIKKRGGGSTHVMDITRADGNLARTQPLRFNSTGAEMNLGHNGFEDYESDGFKLDYANDLNQFGQSFVAWCWKGQNGRSSNTDGTLTSTVSVNDTAGFSLAKYTGTGTNGSTVGHGQSAAPNMIIIKSRYNSTNWIIYHSSLGSGKYIYGNSTNGSANASSWISVGSSTFTLNNTFNDANSSSLTNKEYVAYCFRNISGYQKFGSYTGTGSSGNSVTGLGFQPSWLMVKRTDASGGSWLCLDDQRTDSGGQSELFWNTTSGESGTGYDIDFDSNGFTLNTTTTNANANGGTYIYWAIA